MQTPNGRSAVEQLFGHPALANGHLNHAWEAANIVLARPAGWHLYYQDDNGPVPMSGIRIHRLLLDSFQEAMTDIWNRVRVEVKEAEGYDKTTQFYDDATRARLHELRLDLTGGGYNFRPVTGGSGLSMHAYGIAIDWDPAHNPRGHSGKVTLPGWWFDIWKAHGWHDGRHFPTPDPMHVQFATGV